MFRRKPAPDLIGGGRRFADKNMRQPGHRLAPLVSPPFDEWGDRRSTMPQSLGELDRLGWLKWLWRSSIGSGVVILGVAVVIRDFFLAVAAVGMIISGLADDIYRRDRPRWWADHRNRRVWWALMGIGAVLVVGGIYLSIENYQLSDVLHRISAVRADIGR
jgi:hypothetical protein